MNTKLVENGEEQKLTPPPHTLSTSIQIEHIVPFNASFPLMSQYLREKIWSFRLHFIQYSPITAMKLIIMIHKERMGLTLQ